MRRPRPRRGRAAIVALAVGGAALLAADARGDALPYDEETQRQAQGEVVVVGLDRAPGHALVVYPSRCTTSLLNLALAEEDDDPAEPASAEEQADEDRDDFAVVREGAPLSYVYGDNYCANAALYAIPRGPLLDGLAGLSPGARRRLFAGDPRLLRARLDLPEDAPVVPLGSQLRAVRETLRVLGIAGGELAIGIESHTYTFRRGGAQTLAIGGRERPELPARPLAAAALEGALAAMAGWEERVLKDMSLQTSTQGAAPTAAEAVDAAGATTSAAEAVDAAGAGAGAGATSTAAAPPEAAPPPAPDAAPSRSGGAAAPAGDAADADATDREAAGDEANDDEVDDDTPAARARVRLWITALIAGVVSLGALALIRRRPR